MARAIVSVSEKRGIVELAQAFVAHGVEVCSTGGTAQTLRQANVPVTSLEDVTGMAEMLGGRVKTLHPNVHAGLLARRDHPEDMRTLIERGVAPVDYLVVNLYPFKQTITRSDVSFAEAVEQIDIGGPTMLRAAAKNMQSVVALVDPDDYPLLRESLESGRALSAEVRRSLAAKVFRHTAAYDALIADYLTRESGERYPETLTVTFERAQPLRYGENPHVNAAFYREPFAAPSSIARARQVQGKELSYLNVLDADAALSLVREFEQPAVVAIKHTNPCGVGVAETIEAAWEKAYTADQVSIFGGIIGFNRPVTSACAAQLSDLFLELVVAPSFTADALALLSRKRNLRLLEVGSLEALSPRAYPFALRSVDGGVLVQDRDNIPVDLATAKCVTERAPTQAEWADLAFAWAVVRHVKSNAIVLAQHGQTVGVGAGQMNRVGAAQIAIRQAGERANGAVLASDAFFPLRDSVDAAAAAGITAIIQPGGSIRDAESIEAANAAGIAMLVTGTRYFSH